MSSCPHTYHNVIFAGVPAAVIGAIMSRETRAGGVIGANGRGADPTGYGLMQVTESSLL